MERFLFSLSYVYLEMKGRREIHEEKGNGCREETCESLIYISVFMDSIEKPVFVKIVGRVPEIAMASCPACGRRVNHLGIPGTPYFQCLACGAVCVERELVRESIRRWWL